MESLSTKLCAKGNSVCDIGSYCITFKYYNSIKISGVKKHSVLVSCSVEFCC